MRRVAEGHAVQWGLRQEAGLFGKEECAWKAQLTAAQHGAGICRERIQRKPLSGKGGQGGGALPEGR